MAGWMDGWMHACMERDGEEGWMDGDEEKMDGGEGRESEGTTA